MSNPTPRFQRGDILWVDLLLRVPPGHEQIGQRPVVVVGCPEEIQPLPYRVLIVVPLTRTRLQGPLFPVLAAGTGSLPAESTALVYQVLALDVRRIRGRIGKLNEQEYEPIKAGLRQVFDLPETVEGAEGTESESGVTEDDVAEGSEGDAEGPGRV